MRVLPAAIIALAILLAAVIVVFVPQLLKEEEFFDGPAIDSGARIEIEMLNQRVEDLQVRMEEVNSELARVASQAAASANSQVFQAPTDSMGSEEIFRQDGPNDIIDAYAQVVLIANRRNVNDGLEIAGSRWLANTFGLPREELDQTCREMTNERLAGKLRLESVGPIRVRMLQPAIESLTRVFEKVRQTDPDLYARISTAGSLCVRAIRGTTNRASTHSYGLAVDLNIDGKLDTLGDGKTQLGLTILADFFKEEGWVWGASWRREDSMHFEVSRQKLEEWVRDGLL
jgi:hypothetical protein